MLGLMNTHVTNISGITNTTYLVYWLNIYTTSVVVFDDNISFEYFSPFPLAVIYMKWCLWLQTQGFFFYYTSRLSVFLHRKTINATVIILICVLCLFIFLNFYEL